MSGQQAGGDVTLAVAGAGTMGTGIAVVAARADFPTLLYDVSHEALERALSDIRAFFARGVEKGRLDAGEAERTIARITVTSEIDRLAAASLVIEAVFESLEIKGELLGTLHDVCPPTTVFASNTSTLSITELGGRSGRPSNVVGMHFCLPAQIMKLVEMSAGLATDAAVFSEAWRICERMGQRPVRTEDRPGFILNRFLVPLNNDAIRLVERGVAEPLDVDQAMKVGLGYPMGPLALIDWVGLDTQILLSEALFQATTDPRTACPPMLRRMVAAGWLGRKAGKGFYEYGGRAMFGA